MLNFLAANTRANSVKQLVLNFSNAIQESTKTLLKFFIIGINVERSLYFGDKPEAYTRFQYDKFIFEVNIFAINSKNFYKKFSYFNEKFTQIIL